MNFPAINEYTFAMNHPADCLLDGGMKRMIVSRKGINGPKPICGRFGAVYQMCSPEADEYWAVKFFISDVARRSDHYRKIANFRRELAVDCLVPVEYFAEGIRTDKGVFPVVKMPWVQGETLDVFVERNIANPKKIQHAADWFNDCILTLESCDCAHGDLQHGNIIVAPERMMLVDYDSLYVPGMAQGEADELGLPDYQHPQRSEQLFDKTMDRFSAIVIYTSLSALAEAPELWEFHKDCDYLIANKSDYCSPRQSEVFRAMYGVPALRRMTAEWMTCCEMRVDELPSFSEFLTRLETMADTPATLEEFWKLRPAPSKRVSSSVISQDDRAIQNQKLIEELRRGKLSMKGPVETIEAHLPKFPPKPSPTAEQRTQEMAERKRQKTRVFESRKRYLNSKLEKQLALHTELITALANSPRFTYDKNKAADLEIEHKQLELLVTRTVSLSEEQFPAFEQEAKILLSSSINAWIDTTNQEILKHREQEIQKTRVFESRKRYLNNKLKKQLTLRREFITSLANSPTFLYDRNSLTEAEVECKKLEQLINRSLLLSEEQFSVFEQEAKALIKSNVHERITEIQQEISKHREEKHRELKESSELAFKLSKRLRNDNPKHMALAERINKFDHNPSY
ncbi:MAG: hypothetical protein ABIY70_16015 [Capsulimonas sp.]|uniref:hypothetical protein n=1 Tax=Capsulimonas sp. TaxID=2494211 RepID=UPI0032665AF1